MRKAVFVTALMLPLAALAAPESYTMDPYHTYTHFEILGDELKLFVSFEAYKD